MLSIVVMDDEIQAIMTSGDAHNMSDIAWLSLENYSLDLFPEEEAGDLLTINVSKPPHSPIESFGKHTRRHI